MVVLPITAFSPGIETMGAGDDDDPMAMVKHYFDGEFFSFFGGSGFSWLISG